MNGAHDLGGMHGFGPVVTEENLHTGREIWEHRTVAIMRAGRVHRVFNLDEFRHSLERLDPADYLASSYYERWLKGIERLFLEKGVISRAELAARTALLREQPDADLPRPARPIPVAAPPPQAGVPTTTPLKSEPAFRVGDAVVARNVHPAGHTRLPRYVRGKRGVIHRYEGIHVIPDANAHGLGEQAQPLYNVRFDAGEIWAESAEGRGAIHIDLWESYLEAGPAR